ncbi:hypothetical protein V1264_007684 [Littorina saxatilis]|uniref:Uncharacterized protein n=1 Tax=Littorina saxatilis TaxID=31220 RepID=A0AAN9G420_9CAEN
MADCLALEFRTLAIELDKHATNAKITSTAGAFVGAAGAVVSVVGIAAIPFTGGLSAAVAAVGGMVGAAGGVTAGGAVIAQKIIEKHKMKDVPTKWSTFCEGVMNALGREPEKLLSLKKASGAKLDWERLGTDGSVLLLIGLGLLEIMAQSIELHRQKKSQAGDILRRMGEILDEFTKTGEIY